MGKAFGECRIESVVRRLENVHGVQRTADAENCLHDKHAADVRRDQRRGDVRKHLLGWIGRGKDGARVSDTDIAGSAILKTPACAPNADGGDVEVDGIDGTVAENAEIAKPASAAATADDRHAVGLVGAWWFWKWSIWATVWIYTAGDRHTAERRAGAAAAAAGLVPIARASECTRTRACTSAAAGAVICGQRRSRADAAGGAMTTTGWPAGGSVAGA